MSLALLLEATAQFQLMTIGFTCLLGFSLCVWILVEIYKVVAEIKKLLEKRQ